MLSRGLGIELPTLTLQRYQEVNKAGRRKHPFLFALRRWGRFPPRETSPAAKSEEKRMFSQATNKQEKKYTNKRTSPTYTAHKG